MREKRKFWKRREKKRGEKRKEKRAGRAEREEKSHPLSSHSTSLCLSQPNSQMRGHDFGDYWLAKNFFDAVSQNDPSKILSGPRESLESHLMVFAAEKSRRKNEVVNF
jgi:hypothetical protein